MKKIILAIIILITVVFGAFMYEKSKYVSSEAVFVATDSLTNLSFKIGGKINNMTKLAGDKVQKGELLASLETSSLNTSFKEIEYKIKSQQYNLNSLITQKDKLKKSLDLKSQIAKNNLLKTEYDLKNLFFQLKANKAKLEKLTFDKDKFYKLYKSKKISFEKYYKVLTEYRYFLNIYNSQEQNYKAIKIGVENIKKNLELVQNQYKELSILSDKILALKNQIKALSEMKDNLAIKLNDSNLTAPFDGVIAKKFVNKDMIVKKGSFIYSIVNPKDIYIKVLLSEKKLKGIKIGSKAVVSLDALDDEIDGEVEKIMPVSASTFSLVPRDIASGEFTKLDQRFIVKIKIPYNPNIRIGMSGEVKIYK